MPNNQKTNNIRPTSKSPRPIDEIDRKILSELSQQADVSYAELGNVVSLSPPAVHERVKRLKASGHIRGTVALLDGALLGKPLLAFVHIDTVGWGMTKELVELSQLPEIEEIHSITGETGVMLKVRLASTESLEGLLERMYQTPSVRGTRTYVALSTYLERPVQAGITEALSTESNNISE